MTVFIPERFGRAVGLHLIKQFFPDQVLQAPLILGIHGRPGDGKTFQCKTLLERLGVKSFLISGGELENEFAGQPSQKIREKYIEAGKAITSGEANLAALIINDIDAGIGNWGDMVQYTTNRQNVCAELMHLCDYPMVVESKVVRRIPIIVTGNDFTKLYEPLVRAGRMTMFKWEMTQDERVDAVSQIFPLQQREELVFLVSELDKYDGHPGGLTMAFYSHLRASAFDEALWQIVKVLAAQSSITSENALSNILFRMSSGGRPEVRDRWNIDTIVALGKSLIDAQKATSHLIRGV